MKSLSGHVYELFTNQVHQYNFDQNKQKLHMSDLEIKPNHKILRVTNSSIKNAKNTKTDIISLHVCSNSPYKIALLLGILGYCQTNATTHPTE